MSDYPPPSWPLENQIEDQTPARRERDMRAEVDHLRHWKAEAIVVLSQWDDVWKAAGCPGPLGGSKAPAVLTLIGDLHDEVERLLGENARLRDEIDR